MITYSLIIGHKYYKQNRQFVKGYMYQLHHIDKDLFSDLNEKNKLNYYFK